VWPVSPFSLVNPYANAYTGFVGNAQGRVSPLSVFDPNLPWCVATRADYSQPAQFTPRLCLDGNGQLATAGPVRTPSLITTRPTPSTSHDVCTPGESWDDDDFHYHCTSKAQLRRLPLNPF
ncbi:MAG: hypothetical protein ACRYFU_02845, partial [Janthinobacterium lividum]